MSYHFFHISGTHISVFINIIDAAKIKNFTTENINVVEGLLLLGLKCPTLIEYHPTTVNDIELKSAMLCVISSCPLSELVS